MYTKTEVCRGCGNRRLEVVLDLGEQMLTGIFPTAKAAGATIGPLRLVRCHGDDSACGLLQLQHSYELAEMYGQNYGYRSGLNPSMVRHLESKVKRIEERVSIRRGDLIVDIGSNDGTTLRAYAQRGATLVGIDPTGGKFARFYPPHVELIADFFSGALLAERFPSQRAKVITSFSMFYDLERPLEFMREIAEALADDGIWVFEQSYMPTMLAMNSYDTVCHEHLEYYGLRQVKWMAERAGLEIIDVELNDVNGGSFSVVAAKASRGHGPSPRVAALIEDEARLELDTPEPYRQFAERTRRSRETLLEFLSSATSSGKRVCGIGASTKGNVLLQYCGIDSGLIACIGEVNEEKYGCYTPGSWIPIVPQAEALASNPDYLLVLPWHFRRFFESNPAFSGRTLVFPLPALETVRVA